MGQCHPVPDDPILKKVLAKHTRNHLRIWHMYNFARKILPGTDMGKARARASCGGLSCVLEVGCVLFRGGNVGRQQRLLPILGSAHQSLMCAALYNTIKWVARQWVVTGTLAWRL